MIDDSLVFSYPYNGNELFVPEEKAKDTFNSFYYESMSYLDSTNLQLESELKDYDITSEYPYEFSELKFNLEEPETVEIQSVKVVHEEQEAVTLCIEETLPPKIHPSFLPPQPVEAKEEEKSSPKKGGFLISEYINDTYAELKRKQGLIDKKKYKQKGPGRKRSNPLRPTEGPEGLRELLKSLVETKLKKACRKKLARTDALTTEFVRFCEKIPYHLVLKCSSLSIYKKSEKRCFLYSFLESYSSFSLSLPGYNLDPVRAFSEYSMIFFPKGKCLEIIKLWKKENYPQDFMDKLDGMMSLRDITAKKTIRQFTQKSDILQHIFSFALDVLRQPDFPKNASSERLIGCAKYFLGHE